jgi:hypothetical protein
MNLIDNNQMSLVSIVFSDESTFTLRSEVNRHNWTVIALTIALIGCEKLILVPVKTQCMGWDNK